MAYGYNESFVGGQPPVQIQRVGGWKLLLGAMLAAMGIGFAAYVYLGPYQTVRRALVARNDELGAERSAVQEIIGERDRLKTDIAKRVEVEGEEVASKAKKQEAVDTFVSELKLALGAFGATLSSSAGRARISFPTATVFDEHTSTVISPQGDAALKVLAGTVKKSGFRARVLAKLIWAPPPKDLAQFKNIGEFAMLRAVRVALALAAGGVASDRVAAAGETAPAATQKGKPAVPDRLEIEIEPE